ncbi:hypothetical protein WCT79_18975 [Pectobacterium carotovorum]|uniref:hypothetical protein n=1 Tax=Pectobacterium carotovorum TaxID=554 RepID=UPI003017CFC4
MNEQAQKVLADLLQKASDGIDSAVSFSQAQIPDVVHQLLLWNAVSSALYHLLVVAFVSVYAFSAVRAANSKESWDDAKEMAAMGWFIIGGVAGLFLILFAFNNFDWLKILIAPKLYLLEYAARLIK